MSVRSPEPLAAVGARAGSWPLGPEQPCLVPPSTHVWRADLAAVDEALTHAIDDGERERAGQIKSPRERRLWCSARGVLRELLSRYLRCDAAEVRLAIQPQAKPRLAGAIGQALHFNLSHSGDLALYAFSACDEVGVDVEMLRRRGPRAQADHVALATRAFGEVEAQRLASIAPQRREQEFLRSWTRKEAELKRLGRGLGDAANRPAGRELTADRAGASPRIIELDLGEPAAAALALGRQGPDLRLWSWG